MQNSMYTKDMDINRIFIYCKIKLNLFDVIDRNNYFYMIRQAIDYQYSDFQFHIKKHLDEEFIDDEERYSIFNNDFPIDKIVSEIDKYLMSSKKLLFGFIEDVYLFKYDLCGLFNGKNANFFKVITFNDNNNIITMYPYVKGERLPYIDLNYMKVESNTKVKKLSQIDKFNKRFGIK